MPLPCKMSQLLDKAENDSCPDGSEQQKEAPLQQQEKEKKKRKIADDAEEQQKEAPLQQQEKKKKRKIADDAEEVEIIKRDQLRDEAIKLVGTFNPNDFMVNRAVIRRLAQAGGGNNDKELSLSRGGTSKAAVNKSKALCAYATNGLARLLASKTPDRQNEIRETMLATVAKKSPDLSPGIKGPSRAAAPSPSKKAKARDSLAADMGWMLRDMLRNMHSSSDRRPFLAVLAHNRTYTKPCVEEYLGITICNREWSLIRSHPNCTDAVNGG
jgi:hypothetical protein